MNTVLKRTSAILVLLAWCALMAPGANAAEKAQEVTASIKDDQVVVQAGGKLFTIYRTKVPEKEGLLVKYPYFWPVNGPASGKSVTTESTEPYPHHRSLFFGCDRVNGGNYWQAGAEAGMIVSQELNILEASGNRIVFTDECLWAKPGQDAIIRDERRVTISAPSPKLRLIDFDVTLHPLTDIVIQKTNHSFFSARVMPELSVTSGGTLKNAEGQKGEKATFGQASPWMDYTGKWKTDGGELAEGVAIMQHPENRWYPSRWFTRDYGFFSPTPMYWPEGGVTKLPKGEPLRLRYRVAVHAGEADVAKLFEEYVSK